MYTHLCPSHTACMHNSIKTYVRLYTHTQKSRHTNAHLHLCIQAYSIYSSSHLGPLQGCGSSSRRHPGIPDQLIPPPPPPPEGSPGTLRPAGRCNPSSKFCVCPQGLHPAGCPWYTSERRHPRGDAYQVPEP